MKNLARTLIIALSISLPGAAFAQHDHGAAATSSTEKSPMKFKETQAGTAYGHYIQLKDALVASNKEEAKKHALDLQAALQSTKGLASVGEEAGKVAAASDLEAQRLAFSSLSNAMATWVKSGLLSEGTLYLEFCPMANKSVGAFWLSNDKDIKNPYFGDKMLKCGSVKEVIH